MRRVVLAVVLIASLLTFAVSQAASPSSGTVSATQGSIAYTGSSITGVPPAISRRACIEDQNCDTFDLTVDVPAGFYDTADRVLTISINWADPANDLDLYLCSGTSSSDPQCVNGLVASSLSTGTTTETVIVSDPAAGPYRVIAAAYTGTTDYSGSITFASRAS